MGLFTDEFEHLAPGAQLLHTPAKFQSIPSSFYNVDVLLYLTI